MTRSRSLKSQSSRPSEARVKAMEHVLVAKYGTYKVMTVLELAESVLDLLDDPSPRRAKRALTSLRKLTG